MRILKVKFSNLNSLKGWHEINFNASPFTDSGLFAITGETGSGKTTILDAITVALYDKIARACDTHEIMTYYESESHAEVEFECNQRVYRATWHSTNLKNGKIRKTRDLAEISTRNIIIAEKISEINKKITEITGLDYQRFSRSVMLAQGEFAAFLRADKNDRGALLERITGTDIYSQLSMATFAKAKEEKKKFEELEKKANEIKPLRPNERNELKQKLLESQKSLNNLEIQQKQLDSQINWLKTIEKFEKTLLEHSDTFQKIKAEESAFAPQLFRLEAHRRAFSYKPHWQWLSESQRQLSEKTFQINTLKTDISHLQEECSSFEKTVFENQSLLEKSRWAQKQEIPIINAVFKLDQTIDNKADSLKKEKSDAHHIKQEFSQYQKKYDAVFTTQKQQHEHFNQLNQWINLHSPYKTLNSDLLILDEKFKQRADLEKELQRISDKLRDNEKNLFTFRELKESNRIEFQKNQRQQENLKTKLDNLESHIQNLLKNKTFEEINLEIDILYKECQILGNLSKISSDYKKESDNFDKIQSTLNSKIESFKIQQNNYEFCVKNVDNTTQEVEYLRKIHQQELLIQRYEVARKNLEKNHPCPLCGSTNHPYHTDYKANVSESSANLKSQEKKLTILREELKQALEIVNITETDIKNLRIRAEEIIQEKSVLESEFFNENAKISHSFDILHLDSIKNLYNQRDNDFTVQKKCGQDILNVQKEKENIVVEIQRCTEILQNLNTDIEKRTVHIDHAQHEEMRLKTEYQQLFKQRVDIEGFLKNALLKYDEKLEGESGSLMDKLNQYANQYQQKVDESIRYKESLSNLGEELSGLKESVQQKREWLEKWESKIAEQSAELETLKKQRFELFGNKHPQEEQDKLSQTVDLQENSVKNVREKFNTCREKLASHTARFQSSQTDFEKLHSDFIEKQADFLDKIKKEGFENSISFEQAILDDNTKNVIESQQKRFEKRLIEINQSIQDTTAILNTEKARDLTNADIKNVADEILVTKKKYEDLKRASHEMDFKLNQDLALQQDYRLVAEQLEKQRKIYDRWENLNKVIGSAKGDEFRVFAQGLTLAKLVQLANIHLQKLNNRYLIQKGDDSKLELDIVDTFQADNIRSMKTLSGGESFLVSLALALGLSDLAGQNAKISSLFIDEGFGTLDNAALDMAIATLENLQSNGKTIGVISHVSALKERIATQIMVIKKSSGISELIII